MTARSQHRDRLSSGKTLIYGSDCSNVGVARLADQWQAQRAALDERQM